MYYTLSTGLLAFGLFLCMLFLLECGRRIGRRRLKREEKKGKPGFRAVDGTVFGLLGLLIAFTFSNALSKFDQRRQLIVEETNAVGTAYLRLDLLPADERTTLREMFKKYVDLRIKAYHLLPDVEAAVAELKRAHAVQQRIWKCAEAACRKSDRTTAAMLLLPALNQMIDVASTRTLATRIHPPQIIFILLVTVTLAASLLVGFATAGDNRRSWIHMIVFAFVLSLTVFVIMDIEYPRLGIIRVSTFDQAMVELRQSME